MREKDCAAITPQRERPPALASVCCDLILLSWNRPDLLQPCVERLLRYTTVPSRLLLVDNASTDPATMEYLDQIRGSAWMHVTVVRRAKNEGFSVGMNDGLRRSSAPWICLLNNDILVTEGWLSEMLHVAELNPTIGLMNPMSNEFNMEPCRQGETIDAVAQRLRACHGRWLEHSSGVGFCALLSRRVFEQVGYFDERFEFLYSEDADYSVRVRNAGWICAIAEGAYVYHHQRSTMKQNPALIQRLEENRRRFYAKWGRPQPRRIAYILTEERDTLAGLRSDHIRRLANEGHGVWVFCTRRTAGCVPRHLQVTAVQLSHAGFRLHLLWRLLIKKKRFQQLITPQARLAAALRGSRWAHRAEVTVAGDDTGEGLGTPQGSLRD